MKNIQDIPTADLIGEWDYLLKIKPVDRVETKWLEACEEVSTELDRRVQSCQLGNDNGTPVFGKLCGTIHSRTGTLLSVRVAIGIQKLRDLLTWLIIKHP